MSSAVVADAVPVSSLELYLKQGVSSPALFRRVKEPADLAVAHLAFFVMGLGISVPYNSIMFQTHFFGSCIGYDECLFIMNVFAAFNLPALPVYFGMLKYEAAVDRKFGTSTAVAVRVVFCCILMLVPMVTLPFMGASWFWVWVTMVTGGIGNGLCFGTLSSLSSVFSSRSTSFFLMGTGSSTFLLLALSQSLGSCCDVSGNIFNTRRTIFYYGAGSVLLLTAVLIVYLLMHPTGRYFVTRRDLALRGPNAEDDPFHDVFGTGVRSRVLMSAGEAVTTESSSDDDSTSPSSPLSFADVTPDDSGVESDNPKQAALLGNGSNDKRRSSDPMRNVVVSRDDMYMPLPEDSLASHRNGKTISGKAKSQGKDGSTDSLLSWVQVMKGTVVPMVTLLVIYFPQYILYPIYFDFPGMPHFFKINIFYFDAMALFFGRQLTTFQRSAKGKQRISPTLLCAVAIVRSAVLTTFFFLVSKNETVIDPAIFIPVFLVFWSLANGYLGCVPYSWAAAEFEHDENKAHAMLILNIVTTLCSYGATAFNYTVTPNLWS